MLPRSPPGPRGRLWFQQRALRPVRTGVVGGAHHHRCLPDGGPGVAMYKTCKAPARACTNCTIGSHAAPLPARAAFSLPLPGPFIRRVSGDVAEWSKALPC